MKSPVISDISDLTPAWTRSRQQTRVSMPWLVTRKTLAAEQKQEAAEPFGTDARFRNAGKRLLDTSHPADMDLATLACDCSARNSALRGELLCGKVVAGFGREEGIPLGQQLQLGDGKPIDYAKASPGNTLLRLLVRMLC